MRDLSFINDLEGKKVLVRADFNVPVQDNNITDDGRIRAALPTLEFLLSKGAKVIVMAHLGRPKGQVDKKFSLKIVANRLGELLSNEVFFAEDTVGIDAKEKKKALEKSQLLLLENVRFDSRETSKIDEERVEFANELTEDIDYFVSDGFGVVHRKQASVYDCAKLVPSVAGMLVEKEISALSRAVNNVDERPYTVILGGAKVSDKLGVIDNLISKADRIVIGGGMAFTFVNALGYEVGKSLLDLEKLEVVKTYLEKAKENNVEIILPIDVVVADEFSKDAKGENVDIDSIPADKMGLDIGVKTQELFAKVIKESKVCVWNGPMGVFEFEEFANGTKAIATALSDSEAFSIVGGGDSAAAIRLLGFDESKFSHISTGGGASLELLEGKDLPGISVLKG
ncbi:phosphoglycerate kinase [Actinomyces sp. zg-332]|uniref:phosphoglycerate kinase n=1 Tax=Actinomyces sp. zg-332 TaxID=2708340 RepID=UPI0014233FF5|nr:phosphoglycerate kinase [Actinomyces sp. zg-332]QPK93756.1 phosphoglycerate kinase [Actinomyces sp. zg-332]